MHVYLILIMYLQDGSVAGKVVHQLLGLFQKVISRDTSLLFVTSWCHHLGGLPSGELWLLLLCVRRGGREEGEEERQERKRGRRGRRGEEEREERKERRGREGG